MAKTLAGYEFAPKNQFESAMSQQAGDASWAIDDVRSPPTPAQPIYSDEGGNHFVAVPSNDGVFTLPFIPGSAADGLGGMPSPQGGFVAADKLPSTTARGNSADMKDLIGGMAQQIPSSMVSNWLGKAATSSMLGAAPGGMMDSALRSLGIANPMASGPIGAALGTALGSLGGASGLAGSLLPSVASMMSGGGPAALGQSLGGAGISALLNKGGLGGIPGVGALGGLVSSQLGGGLTDLLGGGGGPSDLLDQAGGCFGGCFPGGTTAAGLVADPTNGGCFGTGGGPDLGAIGANALNSAGDQLLSQWKVDDESSAAEHIAHKAVNDNKDTLKEAATDPNAFMEKMKKFFGGEALGTGMPAVRLTDLDDGSDLCTMGVGTILFEKLPVSRITDTVVGPKSPAPKPILEGAATVLSAGLPTAFLTAKTAVPSMMAKGAATIFVGGAVASISPPQAVAAPVAASNPPPPAPVDPANHATGSKTTDSGGTKSGASSELDIEGAAASTSAGDSDAIVPELDADRSPDNISNEPQQVAVFADGSESESFRNAEGDLYRTNTDQPQSHVRNDYEDHPAADSDKLYLDGPRKYDGLEDETLGSILQRGVDPKSLPPYRSDMKANEDRIVDFVCDKYATNPNIIVDMSAHSRGGASAIGASNRLGTEGCYNPASGKYEPVSVRSLNLYDPVNMTRIQNGDSLGSNVDNINVVYASPYVPGANVSRPLFEREQTNITPGSGTDRQSATFPVTHSGAGGAPGKGDFPLGYDPKKEVQQSTAVGNWMRDRMQEDGIDIKRESDYGFRPAPAPAPPPTPPPQLRSPGAVTPRDPRLPLGPGNEIYH